MVLSTNPSATFWPVRESQNAHWKKNPTVTFGKTKRSPPLTRLRSLALLSSHPSPTVASSFFSDNYAQASSQLQSLYASLPPAFRSYLASALNLVQPHHAKQSPPNFLERATTQYSDQPYSTLFAVLAPAILLVYSLMSWWPGSGRYSPFTSFYSNRTGPPRVTEDDYSYLSGDEDHAMRQNSYGFSSANNTSSYHHGGGHHHHRHASNTTSPRVDKNEDVAPDQIILKHKGSTYPLHFKAFSISEGDLKVRDLRRAAAHELDVSDPRRVKLLYKGKQMRDDHSSCKHENLKQNSEVLCVVSTEPARSSSSDSESEGSDSVVTGSGVDGPSRDAEERRKKRKNHRGGKRKQRRADEGGQPPQQPHQLPPEREREHRRVDHLAPPSEPRPQSTSRTPSPTPKKPTTANEVLDSIESKFDEEFLPLTREYIAHPPTDTKTREFEYKKLSETILTQTLLKLDEVETAGDEFLRNKRKDIVKRIQRVLTELDIVGKPK